MQPSYRQTHAACLHILQRNQAIDVRTDCPIDAVQPIGSIVSLHNACILMLQDIMDEVRKLLVCWIKLVAYRGQGVDFVDKAVDDCCGHLLVLTISASTLDPEAPTAPLLAGNELSMLAKALFVMFSYKFFGPLSFLLAACSTSAKALVTHVYIADT